MNHTIKFHSPDGPAFQTGEKWLAADGKGRVVTVMGTRRYGTSKWDVEVFYTDTNGQTFDKDAWNFQVRYYHQADNFIK